MGMLARLGVVLGLDSAEFSKGLEEANRKLDNFSSAARTTALAGAAAFAAMTAKALQYADAVADTAKANDMAVESILALSKGLKMNGGEAENAGKMLASFTAKIDDAAQGSKDAQQLFARIGVSLKDLASLDTTDLFDKVLTSIAKIEDPLTRYATAIQVFGKAAKNVDFVGLAQGSKEAREQFKEYADAIKQAAEMHDLLADRAGRFMTQFTKEVVPTLVELYDSISKNSEAMEGFWWIIREGTKTAAIIIKYMVTIVNGLIADLKLLGATFESLFKWDGSIFQKAYAEHEQRIRDLIQSDKDLEAKLFGTPDAKAKETEKKTNIGRQVTPFKDTEAERLRRSLELAQLLSEEYRRQSEFELSQVLRRTQLMQLTEKEREVEEAVLRVRDQNSKQLEDIDKKISDAIVKRETELAEELMFQKEQIRLMGQVYEDQTRAAVKRQQEIANSFEFGWNKAFNQYAEDATNYAKLGEQAFNVFSSNISNAISTFVDTGKFKFNDFVKSIIMGLIKIEMQMQAMQLFKMAKSGLGDFFGGGGGLFSGFMNMFGGFATAADGGPINGPTIVGEQGPELFIPKTAGTVIPNQQLSSQLSGSTNITNNYINAIDVKSFEDRLLQSHNAVWAANKYADKSLQIGRGRT